MNIENMMDNMSQSFENILEANSDEKWWAGVGTGIKTVPIDPEQQELQDELEAQAAMKNDLLRELQQADAEHAKAEAARKLKKARAAAGAAVERAQQQVRGHEAAEAAATMARHRIQHRARVFQAATAAAELARQLPNTPKDLQIISQPNKSGTEPKIATLRELAGMELGAKGIGRESRVEHYIRGCFAIKSTKTESNWRAENKQQNLDQMRPHNKIKHGIAPEQSQQHTGGANKTTRPPPERDRQVAQIRGCTANEGGQSNYGHTTTSNNREYTTTIQSFYIKWKQ